jgi:hypothetical protein
VVKVKFSLTSSHGTGSIFGSQYANGNKIYDSFSAFFNYDGVFCVRYSIGRGNITEPFRTEYTISDFYEPCEITLGDGKLFINDNLITTFSGTISDNTYHPVLGIFGTISGGRNVSAGYS